LTTTQDLLSTSTCPSTMTVCLYNVGSQQPIDFPV
jgi:hypothetical protein